MNTHNNNTTFGFWVYLMSDCVLFAALFATYAVLQTQTFGGPGASELFDLNFVLTETLILLTSSFTVGLATIFSLEHKKRATLVALATTFILGLSFVGMEVFEFTHLIAEGSGPSANAFLSSFFVLVGTHGAHVTAGLIWMFVVMLHVMRGSVGNKLYTLSLFWHFLDIVWIFIFTFVYLFGALAL
ncbi:cytochrome o ubiquinol oxidase subunit III [Candidatus Parcubacteria bacterium]|nr:cytochrome o ubiquinol oxidase subunit III [Candidatus Parcubacteria bacterium]